MTMTEKDGLEREKVPAKIVSKGDPITRQIATANTLATLGETAAPREERSYRVVREIDQIANVSDPDDQARDAKRGAETSAPTMLSTHTAGLSTNGGYGSGGLGGGVGGGVNGSAGGGIGSRWRVAKQYWLVRRYEEIGPEEPVKLLVDEMRRFLSEYEQSSPEHFWHRKSGAVVLAVLLIRLETGLVTVRGMNSEVSLPSGSVCAERAAIAGALSRYLSLSRSDFVSIAVLSQNPSDRNPMKPCGVCREWISKIEEASPTFSVITFSDLNLDEILEHCSMTFVQETVTGIPPHLKGNWACKCGFALNGATQVYCSCCKQPRFRFRHQLQSHRRAILAALESLANDTYLESHLATPQAKNAPLLAPLSLGTDIRPQSQRQDKEVTLSKGEKRRRRRASTGSTAVSSWNNNESSYLDSPRINTPSQIPDLRLSPRKLGGRAAVLSPRRNETLSKICDEASSGPVSNPLPNPLPDPLPNHLGAGAGRGGADGEEEEEDDDGDELGRPTQSNNGSDSVGAEASQEDVDSLEDIVERTLIELDNDVDDLSLNFNSNTTRDLNQTSLSDTRPTTTAAITRPTPPQISSTTTALKAPRAPTTLFTSPLRRLDPGGEGVSDVKVDGSNAADAASSEGCQSPIYDSVPPSVRSTPESDARGRRSARFELSRRRFELEQRLAERAHLSRDEVSKTLRDLHSLKFIVARKLSPSCRAKQLGGEVLWGPFPHKATQDPTYTPTHSPTHSPTRTPARTQSCAQSYTLPNTPHTHDRTQDMAQERMQGPFRSTPIISPDAAKKETSEKTLGLLSPRGKANRFDGAQQRTLFYSSFELTTLGREFLRTSNASAHVNANTNANTNVNLSFRSGSESQRGSDGGWKTQRSFSSTTSPSGSTQSGSYTSVSTSPSFSICVTKRERRSSLGASWTPTPSRKGARGGSAQSQSIGGNGRTVDERQPVNGSVGERSGVPAFVNP